MVWSCHPLLGAKWETRSGSRVGIVNECPQNGLFHDLMTIILKSWTAVSEMVDKDNDNERLLGKKY